MSEESQEFDLQIKKKNQEIQDLKDEYCPDCKSSYGFIVDKLGQYGEIKSRCLNKIHNAKCCFCKTDKGALIRLYQGWCCISCFKDLLQGWEDKEVKNG